MHDEQAELVEDGHDGNREERGMRTVAARGLPVTPDPVAGERQHERREAHRAESRGVDEESREEAADGADDAAAQQSERHERDEQQVRHCAEDMELGEDRDLCDRRHEEQDGSLDAVNQAHWFCFVGTSTATASSAPRSAKGCTCTCRNASVSVTPTDETWPIGMP
jgi:hypothetical protein